MKRHKAFWCEACGFACLLCRTCDTNSCGGRNGTLPNGDKCLDCDDAYDMQENPTKEYLEDAVYVLETELRRIRWEKRRYDPTYPCVNGEFPE